MPIRWLFSVGSWIYCCHSHPLSIETVEVPSYTPSSLSQITQVVKFCPKLLFCLYSMRDHKCKKSTMRTPNFDLEVWLTENRFHIQWLWDQIDRFSMLWSYPRLTFRRCRSPVFIFPYPKGSRLFAIWFSGLPIRLFGPVRTFCRSIEDFLVFWIMAISCLYFLSTLMELFFPGPPNSLIFQDIIFISIRSPTSLTLCIRFTLTSPEYEFQTEDSDLHSLLPIWSWQLSRIWSALGSPNSIVRRQWGSLFLLVEFQLGVLEKYYCDAPLLLLNLKLSPTVASLAAYCPQKYNVESKL